MKIFGFDIKRAEEETTLPVSFAEPSNDDGAITVGNALGGFYNTILDMEGSAKTESDLITKYRSMAMQPEINQAVDDIVNEAISVDTNDRVVDISLGETDLSDKVKKTIVKEFDQVLALFDFTNNSYDMFQKFYVDGRLNYHIIIDPLDVKKGVIELRYVDPRKLKLIREVDKKGKDPHSGVPVKKVKNEYYMYSESGFQNTTTGSGSSPSSSTSGIKVAKDAIARVTSGLMNENNSLVLSHLHPASKALNQLRMLEDAVVIYTLTRAPERRIFYIDVGNLPKNKAEQYLRDMMARHKNKLQYNAPGLSTNENMEYFQRKLFKSLKVPLSRLEPEAMASFGRTSEITRDELKFGKFIRRIRNRFSWIFNMVLEKQLVLKGILTPEEFNEIRNDIRYDFVKDNYFEELKESEILRERLNTLRDISDYTGKYFSHQWITANVLQMTEEQQQTMEDQIADETAEGGHSDEDEAF